MKPPTIKYTHISVRGTASPNFYNETSKNHVIIQVASSKTTAPPVQHRRMKKTTTLRKSVPKRLLPPPPPQTRPTIQQLALQLEYRISHHSGYIPKGAVPIAFFQRRSNIKTSLQRRPCNNDSEQR
jgi:hypothetical protein